MRSHRFTRHEALASIVAPAVAVCVVEAALLIAVLVTGNRDWLGVAILALVLGAPLAFAITWLIALPLLVGLQVATDGTALRSVSVGLALGVLPLVIALAVSEADVRTVELAIVRTLLVTGASGAVAGWVWWRIARRP